MDLEFRLRVYEILWSVFCRQCLTLRRSWWMMSRHALFQPSTIEVSSSYHWCVVGLLYAIRWLITFQCTFSTLLVRWICWHCHFDEKCACYLWEVDTPFVYLFIFKIHCLMISQMVNCFYEKSTHNLFFCFKTLYDVYWDGKLFVVRNQHRIYLLVFTFCFKALFDD